MRRSGGSLLGALVTQISITCGHVDSRGTPPLHLRPSASMLILLLIPGLATAQLQTNMLGQYQLQTSEGFNDFMYEIGVNWFTRRVGIRYIDNKSILVLFSLYAV